MKGKKKEIRTCEASGHSKIGKYKFQKDAFKIQLKNHSVLDTIEKKKICYFWMKKDTFTMQIHWYNKIAHSHQDFPIPFLAA